MTFTLAYVPAVLVAQQSTQSADNHLYVPVVGPWVDLADRPTCGGASERTEMPSALSSREVVWTEMPSDTYRTGKTKFDAGIRVPQLQDPRRKSQALVSDL